MTTLVGRRTWSDWRYPFSTTSMIVPSAWPGAGTEAIASCTVGSNGSPGRDLLHPVAREEAGELAAHHLEPRHDLLALVAERGDRALEVVHHGQQPADHLAGRAGGDALALAVVALAVVVELGLQALERVEVLVALGGQSLELLCGPVGGLPGGVTRERDRPR